MHRAIGIDLGTSFGRALLQAEEAAQIVEFVDEQDSSRARRVRAEVALTPSRPGGLMPEMGTLPWRRTLHDPEIVRGAWGLLGASWDELDHLAAPRASALSVVLGARADLAIRRAGDPAVAAATIAAAQLEALSIPLELQAQEPVARGLIAVPLSFGATRLAALHQACVIAGLSGVEPIANTTALAIAHLSEHPQAKGLHIVADLGASTCSIALVNLREGSEVEYVDAAWSSGEGAWSIQRAIMEWLSEQILAQLDEGQSDLLQESLIEARLWDASERAMIALDTQERALIQLPYLWADEGGLRGVELVLDRAKFEILARPTTAAIVALLRGLQSRLDPKRGPIRGVVLAGGLAKVPVIQDAVESVFATEPRVDEAATEATARALARVLDIAARRFPTIRVRGHVVREEAERTWLVGQDPSADKSRARGGSTTPTSHDEGSQSLEPGGVREGAVADDGDHEDDEAPDRAGTVSNGLDARRDHANRDHANRDEANRDEAKRNQDPILAEAPVPKIEDDSSEGYVRVYQSVSPMRAPGIIVWPVPQASTLHLLDARALQEVATSSHERRTLNRDQRRLAVLGPWLEGAIAAATREGERIAQHPGVGADTVTGLNLWIARASESLGAHSLASWEESLASYRKLRLTLPAILMDGLSAPLGDAPPSEAAPRLERWLESDFANELQEATSYEGVDEGDDEGGHDDDDSAQVEDDEADDEMLGHDPATRA